VNCLYVVTSLWTVCMLWRHCELSVCCDVTMNCLYVVTSLWTVCMLWRHCELSMLWRHCELPSRDLSARASSPRRIIHSWTAWPLNIAPMLVVRKRLWLTTTQTAPHPINTVSESWNHSFCLRLYSLYVVGRYRIISWVVRQLRVHLVCLDLPYGTF